MKGLVCITIFVSLIFSSYATCSDDRHKRSATIEEIPIPADKAIRGKRESFPYGEYSAIEISDEDNIEQYEYGSEYDSDSGMDDYEIWDTDDEEKLL